MALPFSPPLFERFEKLIRLLPPLPQYEPEHICTPGFRLFADSKLEMFYAPFDTVNPAARIVIVGITPGFQQMEVGFRKVRAALLRGETTDEACAVAKADASFAGTMRRNLVAMLKDIGLHHALGSRIAMVQRYAHPGEQHKIEAVRKMEGFCISSRKVLETAKVAPEIEPISPSLATAASPSKLAN